MSQRSEDIATFQASLALLDEQFFLDLIKNYVGYVPTPFHKPELVTRLATLFSNDEFIDRLISSIDEHEAMLLTAVALFESVDQKRLVAFFNESITFTTLQQTVLNLEERLLIVPDTTKEHHMMLNPLVEKLLIERVLEKRLLFGLDSEKRLHFRHIDLVVVQALMSLALHNPRNLTQTLIHRTFGINDEHGVRYIQELNNMLYFSRCFSIHKKERIPSKEQMDIVLQLKEDELRYLLFASMVEQAHLDISEGEMQLVYQHLLVFMTTLEVSTSLELRQILLLAIHHAHLAKDLFDPLVEIVQLLTTDEKTPTQNERLLGTIDTDLTISFNTYLADSTDRSLLHLFGRVQKVDVMSTYQIDKQSLFAAFDVDVEVEQILSYLKEVTTSVSELMKKQLLDWREEFSSLTLYDGIVIKTDERLGRLFTALPALQPFIIEVISPRMFFMSKEHEKEWKGVIQNAGVGVLPTNKSEVERISIPTGVITPLKENTLGTEHINRLAMHLKQETKDLSFIEELKKKIEKKARSSSEKEELLARLEQKLILVDDQITHSDGRTTIQEASGFDYQGKLNLCKAAAKSDRDLIEFHMIDDDDGSMQVTLAIVKEFISDGTDSLVRVKVLPDLQETTISIRKAFKVRKKRRSIFFQL
ncbi:MAG: hypothetical protein ACOX0W_06235 [Sphaerochaetaceae bacterium]|jgi:hypothetical protein